MSYLSRLVRRFGRRPCRRPTPCVRTYRLLLEGLEERLALASFIAVGTEAGTAATVRMFTDTNGDGTYETLAPTSAALGLDFTPYGGFTGGVRVALGDFDGDGNDELVTAAGPGGGPHVIVWDLAADGAIGPALDSFFPFPMGFSGGVNVTTGDLDGDGRDELIVAADAGGGPHVQIFSDIDRDGLLRDNQTDNFFAFGINFAGGIRVATGDTDNTGADQELITAAGPGGGPHVLIWDDTDGDRAVSDNPLDDNFFAYGTNFTGGVYVASADHIDGAGGLGAEVITGAGAGGGPHVKLFTDTNANGQVSDNALFDQFLAYGASFTGGVRVAAGDTDHSGEFVEVITAPGPGGAAHIKIFDDNVDPGSLVSDNALDHEFFAYASSLLTGFNTAFGRVTAERYSAGGLPRAIPDSGATGDPLQVSIFVPSSAGVIADLDVSLALTHTINSELDVTLTHVPSGTVVILFTDVGNNDDGFIIVLSDGFPDIATAPNDANDRPVTGTFSPEAPAVLSTFNGLDASGEWRLTVDDDTGGDTGMLFNWELRFTYTA